MFLQYASDACQMDRQDDWEGNARVLDHFYVGLVAKCYARVNAPFHDSNLTGHGASISRRVFSWHVCYPGDEQTSDKVLSDSLNTQESQFDSLEPCSVACHVGCDGRMYITAHKRDKVHLDDRNELYHM